MLLPCARSVHYVQYDAGTSQSLVCARHAPWGCRSSQPASPARQHASRRTCQLKIRQDLSAVNTTGLWSMHKLRRAHCMQSCRASQRLSLPHGTTPGANLQNRTNRSLCPVTHLADIEASCQHVCADKDLGLTTPELIHHPVTVLKRHVTLHTHTAA